MKIGDQVYHKRHSGVATIVNVTVESNWDDILEKTITNTRYTARYNDTEHLLKFYGYEIGKSIFKYEPFVQTSFLDDFRGN